MFAHLHIPAKKLELRLWAYSGTRAAAADTTDTPHPKTVTRPSNQFTTSLRYQLCSSGSSVLHPHASSDQIKTNSNKVSNKDIFPFNKLV